MSRITKHGAGVLAGELSPGSGAARVAQVLLVSALLTPFLATGVALAAVGIRAVLDPQNFRDLVGCLPAGLALLVVIGTVAHYVLWSLPGITLRSFKLDGDVFTGWTHRDGVFSESLNGLRRVVEARSGRPPWRTGWWLQFDGRGWLLLSRNTDNADALVRRLTMTERLDDYVVSQGRLVTPDVKAVVRLLAEQGPLLGEDAATRLGWTEDRWWLVVARGGGWFELTENGWVATEAAREAICD